MRKKVIFLKMIICKAIEDDLKTSNKAKAILIFMLVRIKQGWKHP